MAPSLPSSPVSVSIARLSIALSTPAKIDNVPAATLPLGPSESPSTKTSPEPSVVEPESPLTLLRSESVVLAPTDLRATVERLNGAGVAGLRNGLEVAENQRLFATRDPVEAVSLVLRGLSRHGRIGQAKG